ncbi:MAG TPA: HypC/HybG/HupF family hydrogenase formation chaperone [Chloroflexaceae bacterium]|nr:HypC/HybG/HupF family hydrogenase formation chaperone [Chloroflexaceae bacterium]
MSDKPGVTPLSAARCAADAGHCITCSDEALEARVVWVDAETSMALVAVGEAEELIDISLVDDVVPGETLLAHGGVALAKGAR